jgi:hypothetical protein
MNFLKWIWYTNIGKMATLVPIAFTFCAIWQYTGKSWLGWISLAFGAIPIGIILSGMIYAWLVWPFLELYKWLKNKKKR